MLVLRDPASIAALEDPELRALIEKRIEPPRLLRRLLRLRMEPR
jgi:hypothetical protein